jgi:co-chaperonin GroES (HSP10)
MSEFTVLRPLAGRFIASILRRRKSGLIALPGETRERLAKVLAIGPPRFRDGEMIRAGFEVGDIVIVNPHHGEDFEYDENGEKKIAYVFSNDDPKAIVDPAAVPADLEA